MARQWGVPSYRPIYFFGMIISIKNSNDTIGNRTLHLWVCSAVLQPTVTPDTCVKTRHSSSCMVCKWNISGRNHRIWNSIGHFRNNSLWRISETFYQWWGSAASLWHTGRNRLRLWEAAVRYRPFFSSIKDGWRRGLRVRDLRPGVTNRQRHYASSGDFAAV